MTENEDYLTTQLITYIGNKRNLLRKNRKSCVRRCKGHYGTVLYCRTRKKGVDIVNATTIQLSDRND